MAAGKPPLRLTKVHVLLARDQGLDVSYATLRRYVMDELGWGLRTRRCSFRTRRLVKKRRWTSG
jgi:hypothetical protein